MENVPQLLGSSEHEEILRGAEALGFACRWAKLCAADYGVPQARWRAFIVGSRMGDPAPFFPPPKTHFNPADGLPKQSEYVPNPAPWRTVRDAVGDLPLPVKVRIREEPPLRTCISAEIPPSSAFVDTGRYPKKA